MYMVRHGDLLLVKVPQIPPATQPELRKRGQGVILAEGEATGHAHRVRSPRARVVVAPDGGRYLLVEGVRAVALTHEEHAAIQLSPGSYRVIRQRVYSPEAARNVAD